MLLADHVCLPPWDGRTTDSFAVLTLISNFQALYIFILFFFFLVVNQGKKQ